MKIKYLLLVSAIVLSGCKSAENASKTQFVGSWKTANLSQETSSNSEIQKSIANNGKFSSDALVVFFYPDSSYTKIKDTNVSHGKWSYVKNDKIKFGNSFLKVDNEDTSLDIVANVLNNNSNVDQKLALNMAPMLEDFRLEPFHKRNNQWRVKPSNKESNVRIKERLSNYIMHVAYILNAAHVKNDESVSFANSKGIVKIFRGGIGIVKEDKIKEKWLNSFYDKEDAMIAYNIYKSCLDRSGVRRTKSTGDWVKDDYLLLLEINSKIKNMNINDISKFDSKVKKSIASLN